MKSICFYHSADLDGHCSGAIVKKAIPDVELIGINYGDEFPWDKIDSETTVYMVDFCLQPFDLMLQLNNSCRKLVWIDHHKSAIGEYQEIAIDIYGMRNIKKAACELCWEYFFTGGELPRTVKMLGRYDVWDKSDNKMWENEILPFQFGMRLYDTDPSLTGEDNAWFHLFYPLPNYGENERIFYGDLENSYYNSVVNEGTTILRYQRQTNQKYISAYGFEAEFEGKRAICVNKGMTNSQLFDSVYDEEKHDIMMTFCLKKPGQWTISLYSTTIDVSVIAKKHGGGGHKGAAGFQIDKLPF